MNCIFIGNLYLLKIKNSHIDCNVEENTEQIFDYSS